jgi:D-alanyl-D-alanine carboxypeptidase
MRPGSSRGVARTAIALLAVAIVGGCAVGETNRPAADGPDRVIAIGARGDAGDSPGVASPAGGGSRPGPGAGPSLFPGSPQRLPACRIDDDPTARTDVADWASTIVDTTWALPDDYVPPDLVPVTDAGVSGLGKVRGLVIDDLRALALAAADANRSIAVQSAYRSFNRQADVFAGWVASSGYDEAVRFSARPGHSEHQLGTAVDLREENGPAPWQTSFADRPTGRWLLKHAWEFGFVQSYAAGREDQTCYGAESWHYRYVGRDIAADVHASGLTLREWLWQHNGG